MEADLRETVEKQAPKLLAFLITYSDSDYTVAEFIRLTGVDCLAVAVGTAHVADPKGEKPKLDFARLAAIKEKTGHYSLVMHDSSGVDNETLRDACRRGINKMNIANDLCQAAAKAAKTADLEGNHAYDLSR